MSDNKLEKVTELQEELVSKGREVWLAGLGALASIEQKGSDLFNTLVDQGKKLETEGADWYNSLLERGKALESKGKEKLQAVPEALKERKEEVGEKVENTVAKLEDRVAATVEKALHRLDVPTRSEVKELTDSVAALSKKVDKLTKALAQDAKKA